MGFDTACIQQKQMLKTCFSANNFITRMMGSCDEAEKVKYHAMEIYFHKYYYVIHDILLYYVIRYIAYISIDVSTISYEALSYKTSSSFNNI